ncbi:MAG: hypothetical protein JWQ11_4811 [Rhizobacter sp.]|nr:hypothetical protein [Rhizobacter sp.]
MTCRAAPRHRGAGAATAATPAFSAYWQLKLSASSTLPVPL